jgi:hypothetical protein
MEQAPLTYTSKTKIGVGVSTGTQDTPGLDVTIGFKEVNIAMVPVAVAKYCYKATEELCQKAIYEMQLVTGTKIDAVENSPLQRRLDELNGDMERLIGEQKTDSERLASLRSQIAVADAATAAERELDELGTGSADEAPERQSVRATLMAKIEQRPAKFNVTNARQEAAQIEAKESARNAKAATYRQEQAQLSSQLDRNSNSQRLDAYSVYGKFNGNASGNTQGAGLTAGKVFATGIAAQNLTEFATTADCLANIRFLADMMPEGKDAQTDAQIDAQKAALLGTAGEVCKRGD